MPVISTIAAATARAFGAFKSLGGAADEFFDYVTLLLHGDGTNGAQNNTFLDSSTNNFTITRNGNTTQGTFSPFSQTGWSNYFDGSGDYLTVADNAALDLGTGNFTIEAWIYPTSVSPAANYTILAKGSSSATGTWQFDITSSSKLRLQYDSAGAITSTASLVANTWTHVVVVREGTGSNQTKLYINGVNDGTGTVSSDFGDAATLKIGLNRDGTTNYVGYISNARVVKGTAVYTSAFTPSTTPLTAITNTSLLTCQSNRFRDASTNNFAITVNGNTSVQAFSPFAPTAAYSAATVGGSGYFDGSGDYINTSTAASAEFNLGGGSYTVEFWVNPSALTNETRMVTIEVPSSTTVGIIMGGGGAGGSNTDVQVNQFGTGTRISASSVLTTNAWVHIAVTYNGTTSTLWINGVSRGTYAGSVYPSSNCYVTVGGSINYATSNFNGYISNLRIVKGTAVYTAAFTPPTAPVTAISGTSLLLNFTNGGIIDNTAKNVLETVGNAQISTSVKKFGTGSLAFDGNDSLVGPPSMYPQYINGTGNWTIEFWVYYNALPTGSQGASTGCSWYAQDDGAAVVSPFNLIQAGNSWYLYADNDGSGWDIFSATSLATTSLSTGTWYHIACVRNGSTITLYVNGTSAGTASIGTASIWTNTTRKLYLFGSWQNISGTNGLNGYVDDYRITKGVARYTANFTPPTAAFEDQ